MSKDFYIAKIEEDEDKDKEEGKSPRFEQFVGSVSGRTAKDKIVYPYVQYENDGVQYEGLKDKSDRKTTSEESDRYSKNRIPTYLQREEGGISRGSIEDLMGVKKTKEQIYEENRKKFGYYGNKDVDLEDESNIDEDSEPVEYSEEEYEEELDIPVTKKSDPVYLEEDDIDIVHSEEPVKPIKTAPEIVTTPKSTVVYKKPSIVETTKSEAVASSRKSFKYIAPPLDILKRGTKNINDSKTEIRFQTATINSVLEEFGIGGKVTGYTRGPAVTQYEIKLDPGVYVNKIIKITKNLQMNLEVEAIRIEAPIPGKSSIGIEVPNMTKDKVFFGDMMAESSFYRDGKPLNVILGLRIDGKPKYLSIIDMPHALVAGSTNSGKTVCIHSIINSILFKATPDQVRLILIDPKSNEFMYYNGIPHLAAPVISDIKYATASMKWAVDEMNRRYELLKLSLKQNVTDYNAYVERTGEGKKLPYIVIVIDEFADLMNQASDTFETNVQRLTQKARSAGIHMIIATQRPSVDVIKGVIKANITTKIALKVTSQTHSFTILDHSGAEKLLGMGDALYSNGGADVRIQCAYISADEITDVCQFLKNGGPYPYMFTLEDLEEEQSESSLGDNPLDDPLFAKVAKFVVTYKNASMNQIQKTFNIGYNRADSIMSGLEEMGIVSPVIPGKQRTVLMNIEELEELLRK